MSKKKIIVGLLAVAVLVLGWSFFAPKNTKNESIKIGVVFPMTGNNAAYSEKFMRGLNLAQDEINAEGGINGRTIELVVEDGMANPAKSVSAYQKLHQRYGSDMPAVISGFSSVVLAIAPLTDKDHVVLVNPVASAAQLSQAGDYEFNVMPLMSLTVNKLAEYIKNKEKLEKAAIIYVNTDFGVSGKNIFKETFESLGGQIVAEESYTDGDSDARTQLSKIKQANPDAIYLVTTGKSGGLILKQIGELGIKAELFSTDGIETPETISLGGKVAENLIYISPAFNAKSNHPAVKKFADAFKEKYNLAPEVYGANNYDALKLIALAIKNVGPDGEAIKNYLYGVKNYDGVSGIMSFDSNGDVIKPTIIKTIKNGEFVKLER